MLKSMGSQSRDTTGIEQQQLLFRESCFSQFEKQPDTLSVGCIGSGLRPFRGIRACGFRPQLHLC